MEDENRKARRVQRREYLDNVRELVAFVKKRDKRVAKFQVGTSVKYAVKYGVRSARARCYCCISQERQLNARPKYH
jgi:hypothetical protein